MVAILINSLKEVIIPVTISRKDFKHVCVCLCYVSLQVTSEEDVKKALEIVRDKFGRLDTLVNCAGQSETHQIYNFLKDKSCELDGFKRCINVSTSFEYVYRKRLYSFKADFVV